MKRKGSPANKPVPQEATYTLGHLDQVKVLADPLRIRILEAFCDERTTKQVAQRLGEKPTKLYHHVDALEKVGLIRLARTRQNRGTLEKYYLAVARSFRADARIFRTTEDKDEGEKAAALRQMISTILDTTAVELGRIIDEGDAEESFQEEAVVSFLEIRGTKKELDRIRAKLQALIRSIVREDEEQNASAKPRGIRSYRLTLAYYPMGEKEAKAGT